MNVGGLAPMEALQWFSYEVDGEGEVEDLDWLQVVVGLDWPVCSEKHILN